MSHTPQHDAGAPGDPMIDLVPGIPSVPITVWRTPDKGTQATISERLARRLLAAYTEPGEMIVDLTDTTALAHVAIAGARTHVRARFAGGRIVITDTSAAASPGSRLARIWANLLRGGEPPELADWFGDDLHDPDRPAGTTDTDQPPATVTVGHTLARLMVATWPLHDDEDTNTARLTQLTAAATRILRPDGSVVFVVTADPGRSGDFTILVAGARAAGLRYLQHIIAVKADVTADQLVYFATHRDLARLNDLRHTKIHTDLLVFSPAGARG